MWRCLICGGDERNKDADFYPDNIARIISFHPRRRRGYRACEFHDAHLKCFHDEVFVKKAQTIESFVDASEYLTCVSACNDCGCTFKKCSVRRATSKDTRARNMDTVRVLVRPTSLQASSGEGILSEAQYEAQYDAYVDSPRSSNLSECPSPETLAPATPPSVATEGLEQVQSRPWKDYSIWEDRLGLGQSVQELKNSNSFFFFNL